MTPNRRQMARAYILSGAALLVAVLGSLLFMETASVTLSVPPQKLVAGVTLTGGLASGDFRTSRIAASDTETQISSASNVVIDGTYAAGRVVFTCRAQCFGPLTVPSGTLVTTSRSLGYATTVAAVVTREKPATVAVRATAPGASWNTAPNTVTTIVNASGELRVTNPAAIAGGTDVHSAMDSVHATLAAKVTVALDAALKGKAPQSRYVADGPPILNVVTDHKVGDQVASFTMTITGSTGATAYSDADALALLRAALAAKVPAGQSLTSDPVATSYTAQLTDLKGGMTLYGTTSGYLTPKLPIEDLKARIRGLSTAEARKSLERAVAGSTAEVRVSPSVALWLPLITQHISITVVVEPAGP